MKILNIVLMVVMALLAVRELSNIVSVGPNGNNVLFFLVFSAFAVRRFILMRSGSTARM